MIMENTPIPAAFTRQDERGTFVEVVNRGPWETVITGTMRPGAVLGNHYHKQADLFLFLIDGRCRVDFECVATKRRRRVSLGSGQGLRLPRMESHAVRFLEPSRFILLKSRPFDPDCPDTYEHPVSEHDPRTLRVD
jgi:mannose-6-phosphate isomerase-like protein (cupin superfamily)